jgi:hypothetical protein
VVAYDGGYGLTQLTNPAPQYHQAWSWKENIRAGIELYREKRKEAKAYLSGGKMNLPYTEEQLELETWCMWNSGHYHKWDEKRKQWARDPSSLPDMATANIGWDVTTEEENKGKSEEELHKRDKDEYQKTRTKKSLWRYTGIVYAEHIKASN